MHPTRLPYRILLEVAAEQRRRLEEPCLHLGITLLELERRVNELDPKVVSLVDIWLGAGWRRRLDRDPEHGH
jgi:hypothetical protein